MVTSDPKKTKLGVMQQTFFDKSIEDSKIKLIVLVISGIHKDMF